MSNFDGLLSSLNKRSGGKLATLSLRSSTGKYLVHGEIDQADCLVVPAFGYEKDRNGKITPGACNQYLAELASERYSYLPKILQFEVDDAFVQLKASSANYRIERHRKTGQYLDTREVASQAVEIMNNNGWHKAVLLAHPYHMPRVDSVMTKLGAQTIVEEGIQAVWVPDSAHKQTRSAELWIPYEMAALVFYAKNGWLAI